MVLMSALTSTSMLYLAVLGASVFIIAFFLMPTGDDEHAKLRLGVSAQGIEATETSLLAISLRPAYMVLIPLVAWIKAPQYKAWIERQFVTAGMSGLMTATEFMAYKLLMTGAFGAIFIVVFFNGLLGWDEALWIDFVVLFIGFMFPDAWLNGVVRQRQDNIRRALPYVMDLMTLSVEAGLDFVQGVGKVTEKSKKGPLIDELSFFLGEIRVGASRQQALRNFAWRVNMAEIRSFSALLIQAEILGASVGPVLRAQSDLIRTQRFQRGEQKGAVAAQKILFPLIICIMPAVMIVIFGPVALSLMFGDGPIGM